MSRIYFRVGLVTVGFVAVATLASQAQGGRPKAELTPVVESTAAKAGTTVQVSLNVVLPKGVHVQSDKPSDESVIPTVLTLTPPAGVTVAEVVYPSASRLTQTGQDEPLAVFGPTFTIGVRLTLAKELAAGDVTIPGLLRYQACDSKSCFPPARADAQWSLHVTR